MTERDRFGDVARAIADRRSIDWSAEKGRVGDAGELGVLERLEELDRLAEVHERLVHRRTRDQAPVPGELRDASIEGWRFRRVLDEDCLRIVYEVEASSGRPARALATLIKRDIHLAPLLARRRADAPRLDRVLDPRVAKVLDAGVTPEGRAYFVREYVEGPSITEHADACSMPWRRRASLVLELCNLVHEVHESGILHLELRPSKVILDATEDATELRLVDLGVSSAVFDEALFVLLAYECPEAMLESFAPEQLGVLESAPDRRSDVHGLGVILFELLVGHPPFRPLHDVLLAPTRRLLAIPGLRVPTPSESFVALDASRRQKIARDRSLGEHDLLAALREWDQVIARALARDPGARPSTAAELAQEIEKRL